MKALNFFCENKNAEGKKTTRNKLERVLKQLAKKF